MSVPSQPFLFLYVCIPSRLCMGLPQRLNDAAASIKATDMDKEGRKEGVEADERGTTRVQKTGKTIICMFNQKHNTCTYNT